MIYINFIIKYIIFNITKHKWIWIYKLQSGEWIKRFIIKYKLYIINYFIIYVCNSNKI